MAKMTDIDFYAGHSEMTDPGEYADLFGDLPADIPGLCRAVQGIMLHIHWAERYGVDVTKERRQEEDLRKVGRQLALVAGRSAGSGLAGLPLGERVLGTCRDFSTMLCAMLRHQKIPARPRCGFASYFETGRQADHWICEYWDAGQWRMVDAQLDGFQREALGIGFDSADVPKDLFITAGEAWQRFREGRADPDAFGIMDWHGTWFIRGNLIRDLLSLSKVELLPWDTNDATGPYENQEIDPDAYPLLDELAEIALEADFDRIDGMMASYPELAMPEDWQP